MGNFKKGQWLYKKADSGKWLLYKQTKKMDKPQFIKPMEWEVVKERFNRAYLHKLSILVSQRQNISLPYAKVKVMKWSKGKLPDKALY